MRGINWSPGIGDPTLLGWTTAFLYFVAALVCWRTGRLIVRRRDGTTGEVLVWHALAILLVALGINKQLDLQSAFTEIGRVIALEQGWYDRRYHIQILSILGLIAISAVGCVILLWVLRNTRLSTRLAAVGLLGVVTFVLIRAASFHHVDVLIGRRVLGLRWNWIIEIGSILLIICGGLLRRRAKTSQFAVSR